MNWPVTDDRDTEEYRGAGPCAWRNARFAGAVQAISEAIVADDMDAVATSATAVGMVLAGGESPSLIAKLPVEFKKNGFATHAAFDSLAANARENGDLYLGNFRLLWRPVPLATRGIVWIWKTAGNHCEVAARLFGDRW